MRGATGRRGVAVVVLGVIAFGLSCRGFLASPRSAAVGPHSLGAPVHEVASPAPPPDWRTTPYGSIPRSQIAAYIAVVDTLVNRDFLFGDSTRLALGSYPAMAVGPRARIQPVRGSASMRTDSLLAQGRIIARIQTFADAPGAGTRNGEYAKFGIARAGTYYLYVDDGGAVGGRRAILMPADPAHRLVLLAMDVMAHANPTGFAFARFLWSDADDATWGSCGFQCCRSTGVIGAAGVG